MNTLATDFSILLKLYSDLPIEIVDIIALFAFTSKIPEIKDYKYHIYDHHILFKATLLRFPFKTNNIAYIIIRNFLHLVLAKERVLPNLCDIFREFSIINNWKTEIENILIPYYGKFCNFDELLKYVSKTQDSNIELSLKLYYLALE